MVSTLSYSTDELSLLMLPSEPLLEPLPFVAPLPSASMTPQPRYRRRRVVTMAMLMPGGGCDQPRCSDDTRCRYPSKLCGNTRVRKASGALHRYCAYHRDKANANQKRWVGRQRGTSESPTNSCESPSPTSSMGSSPTSSTASSPTSGSKYQWIAAAKTAAEPLTTSSASAASLSDEDWDSLFSLLAAPAPLESSPLSTSHNHRRDRTVRARNNVHYSPLH